MPQQCFPAHIFCSDPSASSYSDGHEVTSTQGSFQAKEEFGRGHDAPGANAGQRKWVQNHVSCTDQDCFCSRLPGSFTIIAPCWEGSKWEGGKEASAQHISHFPDYSLGVPLFEGMWCCVHPPLGLSSTNTEV